MISHPTIPDTTLWSVRPIVTVVADLTNPVRRDRWGRYLVLPPEGGKPIGYTRATTVAKALDDQSSLINWRSRMTAVGLAQRPDLLALVTTAGDDKRRLDELCDKAAEHGGATIRRDLGSAVHSMLEQRILNPDVTLPEPHRTDVNAILQALAEHGLSIVAGMTEQMIVLDELKIAGTVDLVVEDRNGRRYIADLKTGATVAFGASSWALQLAIYANADAIYRQGPAVDGSDDVRIEMPDVNRNIAFIVHCQPGSGHADLHQLDIAAGWEMLPRAVEVRTWRNRKDLLQPPTLIESNSDRAAQLRARARTALDRWGAEGAREFRDCWPEHVPALNSVGHRWKKKELDDLELLVRGCELQMIPLPAMYADGRIVEQWEADQITRLWADLTDQARTVLGSLQNQIVPVRLWPDWDDQEHGDRPLRERRWRHACLLGHVARLFDPDCIEAVLHGCADLVGITQHRHVGHRIVALTATQTAHILDQLDRHGVLLDTNSDGHIVAHINQP